MNKKPSLMASSLPTLRPSGTTVDQFRRDGLVGVVDRLIEANRPSVAAADLARMLRAGRSAELFRRLGRALDMPGNPGDLSDFGWAVTAWATAISEASALKTDPSVDERTKK